MKLYAKLQDPTTPVHQMLSEYLAFKKNRALALISPDSDMSIQDRIRSDLGTPFLLNSVGSRFIKSLPRTGFETDRDSYERESSKSPSNVQFPYSPLSALPSFSDILGSGESELLDRLSAEMVKSEALRSQNLKNL